MPEVIIRIASCSVEHDEGASDIEVLRVEAKAPINQDARRTLRQTHPLGALGRGSTRCGGRTAAHEQAEPEERGTDADMPHIKPPGVRADATTMIVPPGAVLFLPVQRH